MTMGLEGPMKYKYILIGMNNISFYEYIFLSKIMRMIKQKDGENRR